MNKINLKITMLIVTTILSTYSLQSIPAYALKEKEPAYVTDHFPKAEQHTRTINVIEGQIFTINLDSQPSTGYTWYMVEPMIEDQIQLVSKTIIPYRSPGGRGKTAFTFRAVKAGYETIIFEYARPWSWDIAQQCVYTINIREKKLVPYYPPRFMFPGWNH